MSRSRSILQPAVKVAAAGLGSVVAGPLGGAIGGLIGDVLGGTSSELIKKYAEKFGDKAAEKLVDGSKDALLERLKSEAPTLETAYRAALQVSLKAVKSEVGEEYGDWFENWDRCLGAEDTLKLAELGETKLTPESTDRLFNRVLVRIDAQGAAMLVKSTSLQLIERPAPAELMDTLRKALPDRFEESFKTLIVSEKYQAAWRELELACAERLEAQMRSVKGDTAALLERTAAMDAKMDKILMLTKDHSVIEKRLTEAEARAATAEAEKAEWKKKYLEVVRENPSLEDLLWAGDLDAVAEKKRKQIEQQREEQARSYFELGKIEELRFDYAKAADAYGEAWRLKKDPTYGFAYAYRAQHQNRLAEAISIYESLKDLYTAPPDVARTLNNLANLYGNVQRFEDAEKAYNEALTTYHELAKRNPAAYLPNIAMTLNNLANLYGNVQRFDEAEKKYDLALKVRRILAERNPEAYQPVVANTLNNLAILYVDVQRFEEAERAYDEALTTYRKLAERNPDAYLPDVAMTQNNLAILYDNVQRLEEAEKAYDEALRVRRKLAGRNPEAYQPVVALTLNNLAVFYRKVQRFEEAEKAYDEALATYRKLAERNPDAYLPDVAMTQNNLAVFYRDVRRFEEAEKVSDEALATYRKLAERNPEPYLPVVAMTRNNQAILYNIDERFKEALSASEEAEQILKPFWLKSPEAHGDLQGRILGLRSDIFVRMGRDKSEACELLRRGLDAAHSPALKAQMAKMVETICSSVD